MIYKVINEYQNFYLAVSKEGYKECFNKTDYKPSKDGYILKKEEKNYTGGIGLSSEKVNKSFNINTSKKLKTI